MKDSVSLSTLALAKQPSTINTFNCLPEENSCIIIGNGSLLIECANLLLAKGFTIKGIISQDLQVEHFTKEHYIHFIPSVKDCVGYLEKNPFDYLFSIVNQWILPPIVLKLPRKFAINYHDGPLPTYAGVHATFWAILNREKIHGITWHRIEEGIDTGDIVKQQFIPVDENETSIGLNLKCYQAAIHSFEQLISELLTQKIVFTPQNLENRSYYSPHKRPKQGSIVSWQQPAEEIMLLYKALDFGFHFNPLGLPKICIENDLFILSKIRLCSKISIATPGTIVGVYDKEIQVATSTYIIAIEELQTLNGKIVPLLQLLQAFDLNCEYTMKEVSPYKPRELR